MTMQVDKARLDEMLAGLAQYSHMEHASLGLPIFEQKAILTELLELRSLRSTEGKEGEPVATMHKSATETLFSKGNVPNLMGFTSQPLYATPEAAEAHVAEMRDHVEQLVELLEIIKEHWVDYDHVYSIAVHEARAALTRLPE